MERTSSEVDVMMWRLARGGAEAVSEHLAVVLRQHSAANRYTVSKLFCVTDTQVAGRLMARLIVLAAAGSPPPSCPSPPSHAHKSSSALAWLRLPPRSTSLRAVASRAAAHLHRCADGIVGSRQRGDGAEKLLASVLPMEPQLVRRRGPWFEGWFLRLVDHDAALTVSIVFGSLRRRHRPSSISADPFDEHLIVLTYNDGRDGSERMSRVLLDGSTVRLTGGNSASSDLGAAPPGGPHLSWWSDAHGGMRVDGDAAVVELALPRGVRIVANISASRVPWDVKRPNEAGPEGWLARTSLLPCHYFVHSFGSRASYALWRGGAVRPALTGSALTHVERNWGDSFPTGWVWAQAAARNGSAYLVLTGGRFVIGPLTTDSYVIGLRGNFGGSVGGGGDGGEEGVDRELSWDFRTTDLDRVVDSRRPCEGVLSINASSRNGRRWLQLELRAHPRSFGERIPVPTNEEGFSDQPGCRESQTASLSISAWEKRRSGGRRDALEVVQRLRTVVPLAVLEFGGNFQC